MEWTSCLQKTIRFIEGHLLEDISPEKIVEEVFLSPFYLQKGFKIMTGYSIGEYIRYRRLYLAALEAVSGHSKVIDLAYKYGYETPESFTKAFSRFHGLSPLLIQNHAEKIKVFLPLKIKISIQGGNDMDYVVETKKGFQVIGFEKVFTLESAYQEIPRFWDEFCKAHMTSLCDGQPPQNEIQQAIVDYKIGVYGVCIDDTGKDGQVRYLIAGDYTGGPIPEGMKVFSFADMEWAKFRCIGSMPAALQSVNTKIFQEWLPGNPDYEIAMGANIEWYSQGDTQSPNYESAIWIPVKSKESTK